MRIHRTVVGRGIAWSSRKHWFWLSLNGEIFSFMLALGRFSVTFDAKEAKL